ncbi:MAG: thermonuclease family protein [Patescibacteria group bacterium]|nr:thermonuclease family protein [Patescibacteria group bacterium]
MPRQWLIRIVVAVSLAINAWFGWDYYSGNIVTKVFDGDTFDLKNGTRVRLLDVDSPETGLCGYDEAKQRLEELILGKFVTVKELTYEPYNRDQGLVYLGNQLINETMLKEGWGRVMYKPSSRHEQLKAVANSAKENKTGIFGLGCKLDEPAGDCKIKANIDEDTLKKSYHLKSCRDYDRVVIDRDRGEEFFCTEKEAQAAGFAKAYGCE